MEARGTWRPCLWALLSLLFVLRAGLSAQMTYSARHLSEEEDAVVEVEGEERVNANLKTPHHCTKFNNCDFVVNWTGIEVINFTLTARIKQPPSLSTWIAIGFSDNQNMPSTDVIMCLFDEDDNVTIKNAWNDQYTCSYDDEKSQNLIVPLQSDHDQDLYTCRFSRVREVPDNFTTDLSLSSEWYILLAWGQWDSETDSPNSVPGKHLVVFSSPCRCNVSDSDDMCSCGDKIKLLTLRTHALIMVIVFVMLLPTGAFLARFYRHVFTGSEGWFRGHKLIMLVGALGMLASLGFILGHTNGQFSVGIHQIVGIITISLSVLQVVLALLRPRVGTSQRRKLFNFFHRINAGVILILGELALFLGIRLLHAHHKMVLVWAAVMIVVSVLCSSGMALALELANRYHFLPDPPVGYRKVVLPSAMDQLSDSSEEEVFVREDIKRNQQLFIKEKGTLVFFVMQSFVFCGVIATFIFYPFSPD